MKTLSLRQPWATLLLSGAKEYETRSWRTRYRGPLLIHASQTLAPADRALCGREPFRSALLQAGYASAVDLPRGAIIGLCTLCDCVPAESVAISEMEQSFGDFSPGRYAWAIRDRQRIDSPIPARGRLGLWECDLRP